MSYLTELVTSPLGSRIPIMLEVPVASGLDGPFLVSSSKGFLWVDRVFSNGTLRVAVSKVPMLFMFRDAVHKVLSMSTEKGWGSCALPTAEGLQKVISHLADYDMTEVEILHGDKFNEDLIPDKVLAHETYWVPSDWAVVLPTDRAFVGTAFDFGGGMSALLLHNASRAVGILAPTLVPLVELELPQRLLDLLKTGLKGKSLVYISDLALYSAEELLAVKGVGKSSLKTIEKCLAAKGAHLFYDRNA